MRLLTACGEAALHRPAGTSFISPQAREVMMADSDFVRETLRSGKEGGGQKFLSSWEYLKDGFFVLSLIMYVLL